MSVILVGCAREVVRGSLKVWEPGHVLGFASVESAVMEAQDLILAGGYTVAVSVEVRRELITQLSAVISSIAGRSDSAYIEHYNVAYAKRAALAIADLLRTPKMATWGEDEDGDGFNIHEVCVAGDLSVWDFHIYSRFVSLLAE